MGKSVNLSRLRGLSCILGFSLSVVSLNLYAAPQANACSDVACLYENSLLHDAEYLQVGAELQSQLQALPIARSSFFPSFSSSDTVKGNYPDGAQPGFSIDVHQLLFSWSTFKHIDQAKLSQQKAYLGVHIAQQQLMRRVLLSYVDVLEAKALLSISLEQERQVSDQLKGVKEVANERLATQTRVNMLEANLKFFQSTEQEAQLQLAQKRHQLKLFTGVNLVFPQGVIFQSLDYKPQGTLDDWMARVKAHNLLLSSAALDILMAKKKIEMTQGQFVPTLSFSGAYYPKRYYDNDKYEHFMYGLNLSFNDLNVGSTQAEVVRSQAEYKKAELKQHQVFAEMANVAAVSSAGLLNLSQQIGALNKAVKLEEQTLNDLEQLKLNGYTTLIEVIDQRNKLFATQEKRIQAFAHFYRLKTELYAASGWLVPKRLKEIQKQLQASTLVKS
jgi:outer membrane protein TolC